MPSSTMVTSCLEHVVENLVKLIKQKSTGDAHSEIPARQLYELKAIVLLKSIDHTIISQFEVKVLGLYSLVKNSHFESDLLNRKLIIDHFISILGSSFPKYKKP